MSTSSILGFLFIAEMAIIGIGLSIYLFVQLKRLKQKLAENLANSKDKGQQTTLHDLFDRLINRTRKKISEKLSDGSEEDYENNKALLNQRIEYLKLEKELLDEDTEDGNFWLKLYERLASIIKIKQTDEPTEITEHETDSIADIAKYKRRIANYQAQLSKIIKEFSDYRKYTKKLTSGLSNYSADSSDKKAITEFMMEFDTHDEKVKQRLTQLQQDFETNNPQDTVIKSSQTTGGTEFVSNKASEEEINRLRSIISRQYSSLDELRLAILNTDASDHNAEDLSQKLQAVERSQKELETCVETLEMENQRLIEALEQAESNAANLPSSDSASSKELDSLRTRNKELHEQLLDTNKKLKSMEADYNSLQDEFMRLYSKEN